ncbi:MAG: sigma-54 dependent transcriptional regulator [Planctomycetota bacterium]
MSPADAPRPDSAPRSKTGPTVLVVDDDADIRLALEMLLAYDGYEVWTAPHARAALARLDEEAARGRRPAAVVSDVKMPGMDGLELLAELRARHDAPPVVMVSGHADVAMAVEACRTGAVDFLEKPLDQNRVLISVAGAIHRGSLERTNKRLRSELGSRFEPVGASKAWRSVLDELERAARADVPVLLTGENGTGKEVAARNLHLMGPRSQGPFVAVNCAAIPDELIESELFGHEKGSFTGAHDRRVGHFEAAHGGVLFLDEIGDMPLAAQAALLRALETREVQRVGGTERIAVDIAVVAATNADLAALVESQAFRVDLFYRLSVLPIRVPPLRERREDVGPLAEHFLAEIGRRLGRRPPTIARAAVERLERHPFPGNVRELKNVIEASHVFCDGDEIGVADVERVLERSPGLRTPEVRSASVPSALEDDPFRAETFESFKERSEALFIARKLAENDGNVKRTAENLGMQRSHLYKKLDRYGLRN